MVQDIGFAKGSVLPKYGSRSLLEVPGTLLSLLGLSGGRSKLPESVFEGIDTTGVDKVVLFLFDGFGYREWTRQKEGGYVRLMTERGRVTPITSVFPSTTSTALTTLATGLSPQEHGLIEWYMYLAELDMIIETLPFSPMGGGRGDQLAGSIDPRVLFEGETVYKRMVSDGVGVHTFLPGGIARSNYSSMVHEGTEMHPYPRPSDLVPSLRKTLEESSGPAFYYVYWPMIDTVEHSYGPNTEESKLEATMMSQLLAEGLTKLNDAAARNTLFLATADHGQIFSPIRDALMLDDYEWLTSSLADSRDGRKILPWGGTRDIYLQVIDALLDETRRHLSEALGDSAKVFPTADVVRSGLFGTGEPAPRFKRHVGNLMILPSGTKSVWYRHPNVKPSDLMGVHGGLHEDEMMIPFAVIRGSAINP